MHKILTASATGLGASGDSCGTGTAIANEHSAMAIKAKHFHDMVCIFSKFEYKSVSKRKKKRREKTEQARNAVNQCSNINKKNRFN